MCRVSFFRAGRARRNGVIQSGAAHVRPVVSLWPGRKMLRIAATPRSVGGAIQLQIALRPTFATTAQVLDQGGPCDVQTATASTSCSLDWRGGRQHLPQDQGAKRGRRRQRPETRLRTSRRGNDDEDDAQSEIHAVVHQQIGQNAAAAAVVGPEEQESPRHGGKDERIERNETLCQSGHIEEKQRQVPQHLAGPGRPRGCMRAVLPC